MAEPWSLGSRRNGGRIALAGLSALLLVSATGCGTDEGSASDDGTIKIAVVADQTGALATSLGSGYLGAKAYADKVNADGGINGKELKLTLLDSASDPDTAQLRFRSALEESPSAILHFGGSSGLAASAGLLEGNEAPVVSDGAPDDLVLSDSGWIYMNGPSAPQMVEAGLAQIKERLGKESLDGVRIAMLGLETPYTDTLIKLVKPAAEKEGAELVETIQFPFQVPTFTAQAAKVASAKPDAVMITATGGEVPTVVSALKDAGVAVPIVAPSPGGQDNPTVIEKLGNNGYSAARYFALPSDTSLAATAGSDNAGNAYFTNGWVSMKVVADAMVSCDCTDSAGLNDELGSGREFGMGDLTYGPITFSKSNRAGVTKVQFVGLDDSGKVSTVGTPIDVGGDK